MEILSDIQNILNQARQKAYQSINLAMVHSYWMIGKRIVEEEQQGESRAVYGKALLKTLSSQLNGEFGKGFSVDNLQNMRLFYVEFSNYETVSRISQIAIVKIGELKHQDIGQMQMYVNYYDRLVKLDDENKTIGIILCQKKSDLLVEMTLPENNDQIFATRYQTVLPSKEDLRKLLLTNN